MQAEAHAAKQTGELLRTQIVTKVKAVAAHEKRAERMEAQLAEAARAKQDLEEQLQVRWAAAELREDGVVRAAHARSAVGGRLCRSYVIWWCLAAGSARDAHGDCLAAS